MWLLLIWVVGSSSIIPQSMMLMSDRNNCLQVMNMVANREIVVASNVAAVSCAESTEPALVR